MEARVNEPPARPREGAGLAEVWKQHARCFVRWAQFWRSNGFPGLAVDALEQAAGCRRRAASYAGGADA